MALLHPLLLVIGLAAPLQDAPAELERHQGTWRVVSSRFDGKDAPEDVARSITRVVEDDHVTWYRDGKSFAGTTIRLDTASRPKAIDVIPDGGPRRGQAVLGIYRLDGDELEICMALPDRPRPDAFRADAGSGRTLMKFRREKPGSRHRPSRPPAP
jgi:uncharacterized protein (TIGR03067 family)